MPTDETILGFANLWAARAVESASSILLPSGRAIRLISPPLFVATKLEAFHGRGQGRFGESHDLEDIVNLLDGRPDSGPTTACCDRQGARPLPVHGTQPGFG